MTQDAGRRKDTGGRQMRGRKGRADTMTQGVGRYEDAGGRVRCKDVGTGHEDAGEMWGHRGWDTRMQGGRGDAGGGQKQTISKEQCKKKKKLNLHASKVCKASGLHV
jgi:hypothetical protein